MPILVTETAPGKTAYMSAIVGDYETLHAIITPATIPAAWVDAQGFLKPNIPISLQGTPLTGAAGETPCLTVEAVQIAANNLPATLAATTPKMIAVAGNGRLTRKIIVDTLGRALTAAEIAALNSKFFLSL